MEFNDPIGFIIAGVTLLFSLILFYTLNGMFLGSLAAAIMAGALAWLSYIVLRMIYLTFK